MARGPSKWAVPIGKAIDDIESRLGKDRANRKEIHNWLVANEPAIWSSVKDPKNVVQSYLQNESFGFKSVYGKEEKRGFYTLLDLSPPPAPTLPPPAPPGSNTGYPAEIIVGDFIEDAGWDVSYVARTNCGYDLMAKRTIAGAIETRVVEVKSSIGMCNPVLTENEWDAAKQFGQEYWLAIVPNFSPKVTPTIYWIRDPFKRVKAIPNTTKTFRINKTSWTPNIRGF